MSENIAAAIAAKNEVIAQQGTSLDEVAAILETKAAGGTDISLGLTSAAVGQIIKVKAVDESGKPTAWEAADMSEGIALDTTLTQSGKAADAKAVGDALAEKQPKGDYLTQDNLQSATNAALEQAKASGEFDGADGAPGKDGADGKTPYVGDNGNWFVGSDDTGKPSRGAKGDKGDPGATPNLTVGTVTTLEAGQNATASMGGTAESPVLNLGIPRGAKGEPGSPGAPGAAGKSAYQYAQDGGYNGTETEFAEKLAQEQLTGTTGTLTPTQVYDAVSAGIPVKVQYTDSTYGLLSFTAFNVAESLNVIVSQTIVYYNGVYILAELNGGKSDNTWGTAFTTLAEKADIPSALPNPNALKFTGAMTGSYNGSAAVTVNIPSAVTDDHINSLIDAKLGVIENGSY